MKLSLIVNTSIGEGELRRRREFLEQFQRTRRAQFWTKLWLGFVNGVRGVFIFLLGATLVVFSVSHRTEINSIAQQKITRVASQIKSHPSPLRQAASNYEKEVEDAAK